MGLGFRAMGFGFWVVGFEFWGISAHMCRYVLVHVYSCIVQYYVYLDIYIKCMYACMCIYTNIYI